MSVTVEETVAPATVDVPTVGDEEGYRREVLLRAAELVEENGWTTGSRGMRVGGPHCILGAIAEADPDNPTRDHESDLWNYPLPGAWVGYQNATSWNDRATGLTGTKVAAVLRRMANGTSFPVAAFEEGGSQ